MPRLNQILEKKTLILDLANLYGFQNIRIYPDSNSSKLTLLISKIPNKDNFRPSLEAVLSTALDCQIVLLAEENLKELYKEDVLKSSVPIDDDEKIMKLLQSPFSDINFLSASKDKDYIFNQERALKLAEKIAIEQKHPMLTNFFKSVKEKDYNLEKAQDNPKKRKWSMKEIGEKSFDNLCEEVNLKKARFDESIINEFMDGFIEKAKKHGINIKITQSSTLTL